MICYNRVMGTLPEITIRRIDLDCHWVVVCKKRGILKRFVSESQALHFKHVAETVARSIAKLKGKGSTNEGKDGGSDPGCQEQDRE